MSGLSDPSGLKQDSSYEGRVVYDENTVNRHTLTINNLRETDSAEYKFRLITNQGGRYNGFPGVTLTVTGNCMYVLAAGILVRR